MKNNYPVKYIFPLILLLLFSSCDLFNTRDAEGPNQPKSNYEPPVEYQIVISNLISSFKDRNTLNYLSCFSDSGFSGKKFEFFPSAGASSQFPELSELWDKNKERQYFDNIMTKVPETVTIDLSFSNENYTPQGDSRIYTATYTLTVPHNDPNIPVYFHGDLRFIMSRDSRSLWSIDYWLDNKTGEDPSWSELKGRFY